MTRLLLLTLITVPGAVVLAAPAEGPTIATMDELKFTAPKDKGKAELVEGKFGKAVRFSFDKDARSAFFTNTIRGTAEWDKAAGFSFWVRGDGTDSFAGLQLIHDEDYAVRYDLCVPVKGKEWQKVTVAWGDLIPVLPGPKAKPLAADGNPPSKVSALWFGRWWYWGDYPAHTFTIDEIRLEPKIERDAKQYKPEGHPLARVLEKLKAGKPITVVSMGDSLTDVRHHANRKTNWPTLLAEKLKARYKSEVTIQNPAIGGTQLRQNLVLIPRWPDAVPEPDLVTIWFGGNDWDAGMRGPEFEAACVDAIDRVRRATLVVALRTIVPATPPPVVKVLSFEMQADWREFPVYAFAMDEEALNEVYFEPPFYGPVLPGLGELIPHGAIDQDQYEAAGVATFESGARVLAEWFGACWHAAGGVTFPIPAYINLHDSSLYFDL